MEQEKKTLCNLFKAALELYFHSDRNVMAHALYCSVSDVDKALEQECTKLQFKLFEQLATYCTENAISMDGLIQTIRQQE